MAQNITKDDLTIVYYTSNYLDDANPYFLENTKRQLVKAIGDLPLIVVSQKPVTRFEGFTGEFTNICLGNIGRSHLNLYKQILIGCQNAKTKWVAMAEDDILYSWEHFHHYLPPNKKFAYDMNKVSIFTWTKPPMFSFRTKRRVVNALISRRDYLVEALEERFNHFPDPSKIDLSKWGDPGRYEALLGVTPRESEEFYSTCPNIVFTHENAFGYLNHGKRKRLGDLRIIELAQWGRAEDILKLYYEEGKGFQN